MRITPSIGSSIACVPLFPIRVQISDLSARKSLTSPQGCFCPTHLRFWDDFHTLQRGVYTKLLHLLAPADQDAPRLFTSHLGLASLGEELHNRVLINESDFQSYARFAVENQVSKILDALKAIPETKEHFPLLGDIRFDNHANTLSERLAPHSSQQGDELTRPNTDQFCVHRALHGRNNLLTILEYKPSAKLPPEQLRAGFQDMNVWEDVVQRSRIPVDREEKLQYIAQLRAATVATQVYDSMIKDGVPYACLTTGLGQMFFHVSETEPETLMYFLAEPNLDVDSMDQADWTQEPVTAVDRIVSLCLMGLTMPLRSQAWRHKATGEIHRWAIDIQQRLADLTDSELSSNPSSSEYSPSSPIGSSPVARLPTLCPRASCQDKPTTPLPSNDTNSDSPSNRQGQKRHQSQAFTPSPTPARPANSKRKIPLGASSQKPQEETKSLDYCSQRCLLGLRGRGELDAQCPNYERHRCSQPTDRHLIDQTQFAKSLKVQLDDGLDHHITPCGLPESGGVSLRLSLMPYGYTFIGKGTPIELANQAQQEARDLSDTSLMPSFCVKQLLLTSWAGEPACRSQSGVLESIKTAKQAITRCGIRHLALSQPANTLWNPQLKRVQLVNFDMATWSRLNLLPSLRHTQRKRLIGAEVPKPKRPRIC
ncbi:uncharacterized protein N7459_007899 [Penicillium hispanicum]|uniref:uncharacterized protein n=1 Tax=Penicillium hispanicum TaxID=1080232 RepID=UPI002541F298|nr:uncharacterized protein N7459_007899 [Penicillium hispanicum]KAJ5573472.1 hypothetical protein N7459_007899 [Penicillium hispanicum]